MSAVALNNASVSLDDEHYAAIAQQKRRVRALYRAARRALEMARLYFEETDLARAYAEEIGRSFEDPRVAACLREVRYHRLSIRSLRRSL